MADHLRRVIWEHRFERELEALIPDAADADRFVEGAEFLLARDPETFKPSSFDNEPIKPSVNPSAKYSSFVPPVRFFNGRTATDLMALAECQCAALKIVEEPRRFPSAARARQPPRSISAC